MDKSSPALNEFVNIAVSDLMGKVGPSNQKIQEQVREESPAMSAFVDIALKDLTGADHTTKDIDPAKITENADELKDMFAKSVMNEDMDSKEKATKLAEEFKVIAGKEAEDTLEKLLKGIR